jgi:ketosteroid isomerase-like protein
MSMEDEVRAASSRFYAALSGMANGDAGAMADCWSHSPDATAMHPIGGRDEGWEAVRASFAQVAGISTGGSIRIEDALIRVSGDVAWEIGRERGRATMAGRELELDHRVTNVYRREGGAWKLVHHHTDVAPAMVAMLEELGGGA